MNESGLADLGGENAIKLALNAASDTLESKRPALMHAAIISEEVRKTLDAIYRSESRRVLATLIRLLGDFELAEEALHEAITAAIEQWPREGLPANPRAWLISTGRFKAIDQMRRRARFRGSLEEVDIQKHFYLNVKCRHHLCMRSNSVTKNCVDEYIY